MNTEQIRFTDTNSADDSKGKTWGLDGDLFWYLAGGAFAFVVLLLVLFSAIQLPFLVAVIAAAIPLALSLLYVFAFRQGKPPGYDLDCLDYWVNGRGFGPEASPRQSHPLRDV